MPEPLSQRDSRWKDIKLGTSSFTLGTHGCTVTSLAMLLGLTPDVVNSKLNAVKGFKDGSLVIWSKLPEAFPQIKSATRYKTYDNDVVKNHLPCLVEVDGSRIGASKHWVTYIGNGQLADPWTGVIKSTSYYPATGSAVIELNPNYNPAEEKLYTESQMTSIREQRDHNYDLFKEMERNYEGQKTITEEIKKELNGFIETVASKLGTINDKSEVIGAISRLLETEDQLNKANKKLQDQERQFEIEKKELIAEIEKLRGEVTLAQKNNANLERRLNELKEQVDNVTIVKEKAENCLLQLLTAIKKLLRIK